MPQLNGIDATKLIREKEHSQSDFMLNYSDVFGVNDSFTPTGNSKAISNKRLTILGNSADESKSDSAKLAGMDSFHTKKEFIREIVSLLNNHRNK